MKISSTEDTRKVLKVKLTHRELKALQAGLQAIVYHNATVLDLSPFNQKVVDDFITQLTLFIVD